MIVPFVIEPAALEMVLEDPLAREHHHRLLDVWRAVGVLVGADRPELHAAIAKLPSDLRKRWMSALQHQRLDRSLSLEVGRIASLRDLDSLGAIKGVACLHPDHARSLGLPTDRASTRSPMGCEVCRYDLADRAESFCRAQERAREGIFRGTPTDQVWRERFHYPALLSKQVVVVDRYAAKPLVEGRKSPGLARFLRELDRLPGERKVTICTALPETCNEKDVLARISALLAGMRGTGLLEIDLAIAYDSVYRDHAHDRHVRFDKNVMQIGKGLEVLEGERVLASSDFDMKPLTDFIRQREDTLTGAARLYRFGRIANEVGLRLELAPRSRLEGRAPVLVAG